MRAMKHRLVLASSTLCASGLLLTPTDARAQGEQVVQGEFSVQRFEPAMGPRNYFSVEGARTDGELGWSAGLFFDYANRPFVLRSCLSQTDCNDPNAIMQYDIDVVSHLITWNFMGTFTPVPWVQIGLRLPLAYSAGDDFNQETGAVIPDTGRSTFGLGDPMLEGKFRFLGEPEDMFVLGAAVDVSAPLGHATAGGGYLGNDSPVTVGGRAIVDGKFGPVTAALNLRGIYRKDATVGSTTIGPEFRYGVGLGYEISEEFQPGKLGLVLTVGGGAGVIQGVGVPVGRALVGIGWVMDNAPEKEGGPVKKDGAGTAECPFETGCAGVAPGAPDKDKDGFPDAIDKCPEVAGIIKSGIATGCPDRDKDGVADKYDLCPNEAEDTDGYVDWDGCPDPDNDDDGVRDDADECDGEPEVVNGFEDTDGCPDEAPDADGDGIPDTMDTKCPRIAEILNGMGDMSDGCPENGMPLVKMNRDSIALLNKLTFADDQPTGELTLRTLNALAAGLKNYQQIFLVKVHVTTVEANTGLGARRAEAIMKLLTDKGVKARRLYAQGETGADDDVKLDVLWSTKKPRPPEAGPWPPPAPSDLAAWYAAHPAPAQSAAPPPVRAPAPPRPAAPAPTPGDVPSERN
jgi:OOP family OmpA-OmpF porin